MASLLRGPDHQSADLLRHVAQRRRDQSFKMQKITQNLSGQESPQSLSSIQKEIDEKIVERGMESLVSTKLTDDGLELSLNSGIVFDSGKALIRNEVTHDCFCNAQHP